MSLDGVPSSGANSGSFVNGQFRESGADNYQKRKKTLTRKDKRQQAKEAKKAKAQTHELWKKAKKLGVSVEQLLAENSNDKKRKREDMHAMDDMEGEDYASSLEEAQDRPIKKTKTRAELADEKVIKEMEKKLGLTGKKKKSIGDGLDFLFEGIGSDAEQEEGSGSDVESGSVSDEASASKSPPKARDIFGKSWKGASQSSSSSSMDVDSEEGSEQEFDDSNENDLEGLDSDEMMNGESGSEESSDLDDGEGSNLESGSDFGLGVDDGSTDSSDDGTMFGSGNPYIKRYHDQDSEDSEGEESENSDSPSAEPTPAAAPSSGKYIPPALRARMAAANGGENDAQLQQMRRELRGHVNRLSDANLEAIYELIEGLFSRYPRKSVNEEMVKLFMDDCIASVGGATVFTFAPTYAALTMMLHLTVGAEVGGNVVQGTARALQQRLDENDIPVLRNLLLMFINFYNYDIVHCSMVYDIIRILIEKLNEQNVDLLLLVIQRCGMQLRKDDPLAIKGIIDMVNVVTSEWRQSWEAYNEKKALEETEMPPRGKYTKRVQFMIESLNDVKNNKLVSQTSDHATVKMKAAIEKYFKKRFKKRPVAEAIRVAWSDLISSDHLGRWWVVGSATQIPSDQRAEVRKETQLKKAMTELGGAKADTVDSLARAQHMTTATRKAIFSIIVTSEDYIDACEKLTRFDAKDVKPREIAQIVLHCCQQEATWNPYYASLSEKLCSVDPHFRISFKFLLWEKFDDLEDTSVRALTNIAKLYAFLIGQLSMSPTILKAFPFEAPSPKSIVFLRMLLMALFLEFEEMNVLKMFVQAANTKGFSEFAQNIDIFLQTNLKTIKPDIVKHARLQGPPHRVSDSSAAEHIMQVSSSLRQAMGQVATI
jgi:nucleolar MIF4G domain-containing protein 1